MTEIHGLEKRVGLHPEVFRKANIAGKALLVPDTVKSATECESRASDERHCGGANEATVESPSSVSTDHDVAVLDQSGPRGLRMELTIEW